MTVTASHIGALVAAEPGQRMHADDQDEREQDGSDDGGELRSARTLTRARHGEHDDQPTWRERAVERQRWIGHTARCHSGSTAGITQIE